LRQVLKKKSEEENWQCKCIRCREIKDKFIPPLTPPKKGGAVPPLLGEARWGTLKLFRQDYDASNGKEIFLSYEDKEE